MANASPACTAIDIGFVNPLLYQLAGTDYAKYFNDITTGNNDANDDNGGLYPATAGYDMATGLGSPIGTALAQALCDGKQAGITLTNPGEQSGVAGTPVKVSLSAADVNDATISYTAQGLPVGLAVDPATGVITGTPTSPGVSTVTAVATDSDGAAATVVFGWSVAPRLATTTTTSTTTTSTTSTASTTTARPPTVIPRAVILKLKIANLSSATVTFTATGGHPQAYQCALAKLPKALKHQRAPAPRPNYHGGCSSPVTYRHLKAARYEFFVHARGISGGYSAAATRTFTIG